MKKLRFGTIHADVIGFTDAVEHILSLVRAGHGGYVVTPNVDHIVLAETVPTLRDAYHAAALSLADGMPLLWMARLLGHPLPEKVSGSDLVGPLLRRATEAKLRVYFLGGAPGVGERAAGKLCREIEGLEIVGSDAPDLGFEKDESVLGGVIERLRAAQPDIVLVALGCPKQELFMHQVRSRVAPSVMLGIGATLDFIAGVQTRAPAWMQRSGLEWVHRLLSDPKRMAHRYLVRDRAIGGIFVRMMRTPHAERAFEG